MMKEYLYLVPVTSSLESKNFDYYYIVDADSAMEAFQKTFISYTFGNVKISESYESYKLKSTITELPILLFHKSLKYDILRDIISDFNDKQNDYQEEKEDSMYTNIYDYMYWRDYNEKIKELAEKALPEKWNFEENEDYSILKNYLRYTFNKLQEENKVIETDTYCVFNTGLFSHYYEPIYVYGEPFRNPNENNPKWYFKGFKDSYELGNLDVEKFPERADYFSDTSRLVFNWHMPINVNHKHILDDMDTSQRLPDILKDNPRPLDMLKGVIDTAIQRVIANYKLAVPHYYQNKIQLMIPLCFGRDDTPDAALVLDKKENYYQATTCLDMKMAYMDARLIAKPESNWLIAEDIKE